MRTRYQISSLASAPLLKEFLCGPHATSPSPAAGVGVGVGEPALLLQNIKVFLSQGWPQPSELQTVLGELFLWISPGRCWEESCSNNITRGQGGGALPAPSIDSQPQADLFLLGYFCSQHLPFVSLCPWSLQLLSHPQQPQICTARSACLGSGNGSCSTRRARLPAPECLTGR